MAVVLFDPGAVAAIDHCAPPILIFDVPVDRLFHSNSEVNAAPFPEFSGKLRGIDRVSMVMTRPVRDKSHERTA